MVRGYSVDDLQKNDRAELAVQLFKLSQVTWGDLKKVGRHALGFEKIARDAIRAPIPAAITPDVTLIAFRFSGLKSMVGFRSERIFHIVWIDHDRTVYKH